VTLLIINTDRNAPRSLMLPLASLRYTLQAGSLRDSDVRLNGISLTLNPWDELPQIVGAPTTANSVTFEQATITFLAIPTAGNHACQ
jgi:heparanase 1